MAKTIVDKKMSGTEWKVKKARTRKPGHKYEYYVTKDDAPLGDPVYSEQKAREIMNDDIEDEKDSSGGGLFDFGSGGGGGSDDFGLLGENDSDTEDFDFL